MPNYDLGPLGYHCPECLRPGVRVVLVTISDVSMGRGSLTGSDGIGIRYYTCPWCGMRRIAQDVGSTYGGAA
jgi:hypothetical protein